MNEVIEGPSNPFLAPAKPDRSGALTVVTEAEIMREQALIQTAATIAQARPRNPKEAWEGIMRECDRVALAAIAVYAYPRGNEIISDASIHLLKAISRHWGNMYSSVRIMASGQDQSLVRAMAWDLESNAPYHLDFVAPHVREAGGKVYPLDKPRDIYEAVMNLAQRRLRTCLEALIPSQVIEDAKLACDKKLASLGPPEALLQNMLTRMQALGIKQKHLEDRLGRPLTKNGQITVNVRVIVNFDRIAKSIEDGVGTPVGFFPTWEPTPAKPTGPQTIKKTAVHKSQVWPQSSTLPDGSVVWFGAGNEKADPTRHEFASDGRPLVNPDGTLVGKQHLEEGRQRTDAGVGRHTMSPAYYDPDAIIAKFQGLDITDLEALRKEVSEFPIRHPARNRVIDGFNESLTNAVRRQSESWPQPITLGDGRQVLIDSTGEAFDEAKHAKSHGGQPSMTQNGRFRKRRSDPRQPDPVPPSETTPASGSEDEPPPSQETGQAPEWDGPKPSEIKARMESATNRDELDAAGDLARGLPKGHPAHAELTDTWRVQSARIRAAEQAEESTATDADALADQIEQAIQNASLDNPAEWAEIEAMFDSLPATHQRKPALLTFFHANRPI